MREQMIQDATARLDRIVTIANLMELRWEHDSKTVIQTEYSFAGGRVDVLATFNGGCNVLLAEVKQGTADAAAVDQLASYRNSPALREALTRELNVPNVNLQGVVIAESFGAGAHEQAHTLGIGLLEFQLEAGRFPFRPPLLSKSPDAETAPTPSRSSLLIDIEYHRKQVPPELQTLYDRCAGAFLDKKIDGDGERLEWLYRSVKQTHVSVRYKGELLVCLWPQPRKGTFLVGHAEPSGEWNYLGRINRPDVESIEMAVRKRMDAIDEELRPALKKFSWTDLDSA